jgi:hypothetical protein
MSDQTPNDQTPVDPALTQPAPQVATMPQGPQVGPMIIGIVVGMGLGGTVLFFCVLLVIGVLSATMGGRANDVSTQIAFVIAYIVAAGAGLWGVLLARKAVNFLAGLIIGLAAGLLGSSALCNLIIGASMH